MLGPPLILGTGDLGSTPVPIGVVNYDPLWTIPWNRFRRREKNGQGVLCEERAMELAKQSFSLLSSNALPLWATIIAGVFVIISLSLSLYLLFNHLSAYKNPEVVNYLSMFELLELCFTWPFLFTHFHTVPVFFTSFRNRSFLSASFSWCPAMQSSR